MFSSSATTAALLSLLTVVHGQSTGPVEPASVGPASTGTAASVPPPSQSIAVSPPTCIQPRSATDPTGTDISAVLNPAVSSACDINQQQTATSPDGTKSIIYFKTGEMFFNITNPVGVENTQVVPPNYCPDHFNAIVSACVDPSGQFWGGWTVAYSTNWSISNFAFPANGLPGATVGAPGGLSTGAVGGTTGVPGASTGVPGVSTGVPPTVVPGASTVVPGASTGIPAASTGVPSTGVPGASTGIPGASTGAPGASTGVPEGSTGIPGVSSGVPGASTGVPGASTGVPEASTVVPGASTGVPGGSTGVGASTGVPGASTGVPGASTGIPSVSTGVPGASTGVPGASTGVPGVSTGIPGASTGVPVVSTGVPGASTGIPGASTGVPGASTGVPGASTGVPGASTGVPGASTGVPGASTGVPGASTGVPGASTGVPGASTGVPGASTGVPGASTGVPGASTGVPGASTGEPGISTGVPGASIPAPGPSSTIPAGGSTAAPGSTGNPPQPTVTHPVSSVTGAFAGTDTITSFPISGGGALVYTKGSFTDLATITEQTTVSTDLTETLSGGGIFTFHGPVVVGPGGTYWGPPGINIPSPPGINVPCIWPFCSGGGDGGGSNGEPGEDPKDPESNKPSSQQQTTQQESTQQPSTTQPSSSQASCSSKTVTDFWVSCSTGAATVSCSTYSSSVVQGCTVTAETVTTAAACTGGGGGFSDDPLPSGYDENGPDYPTPIWSEIFAMETPQSTYLQYSGAIVSGNKESSFQAASPGSTATSVIASTTNPASTTAPGSTRGSTGVSSTSAPAPTESSPMCVPFQDPHQGINACNCESGTVTTQIPMMTGASNVCGYTSIPAPTSAPPSSTTQGPEYPFTFTDLNYGPIVACKSSSVGNAGGIPYTVCEGDRTTVGTDTAIAAHHSSFAASISRAQASSSAAAAAAASASAKAHPTADCTLYDSGFAYHLIVTNINGWAGPNGDKLHNEEDGCGALTGWKWYGDSAEFYLDFFIKAGCVERAIKTAGGPDLSCHGGGIGKRDALAGSLKGRKYGNMKRQELANADHAEAVRLMDEEKLRKYEEEMGKGAGNQKRQELAGADHEQAVRKMDPKKFKEYQEELAQKLDQRSAEANENAKAYAARDLQIRAASFDLEERGNIPSTIRDWIWPPPPAPPPVPADLPVEWWQKATVPGVDQCNDNVRRKNQVGVGGKHSVFYTGLGDKGYASLKIWLSQNTCIQGPFVHWDNVVVQGWLFQITSWIGRPYLTMQTPDEVPDRVNNKFLNHISQAFAEMSKGDAYLFMPVGSGDWDPNSVWAKFELPALTQNPNVEKIYRIDLDLTDPNNPTNPEGPKLIWQTGDPKSDPAGIRERTNPEMSPLTDVIPVTWGS